MDTTEGPLVPNTVKTKSWDLRGKGEQGPDSRRSQEVGPSPPLSLGPPNKQMWVMEVSLRATCNHCKDLTLCKDIWGFSQHQGGPDGQGRLRDLFTRE